ncbi:MAG: AhpC/TSA family protein [Bacteroidales bacterium]|nr:AhpC/TSA family protein [Bacteroidales bacterium]
MKKFLILASVLLAGLAACTQNSGANYTITGTGAEGTQVVLIDMLSGQPVDTAIVTDGTYTFKGNAEKNALLAVSPETESWRTLLFNDGKPVKINADHSVSASKQNEKLSEFDIESNKLYEEAVKAVRDESLSDDDRQAMIDKVGACYTSILKDNMDNLIPAAFLPTLYQMVEPEVLEEALNSADAVFMQHPYAQKVKEQSDARAARQKAAEEAKQKVIGQPFLDLEEADANGKMHKLSEYVGKGKWVLVDFWASWCGPCEAEMPNVVAAYEKYHAKGFEIVGLSFDNDKEPWVAAIKDWNMPWIHLSDLKGWKTVASEVYNVNSIPDNLLIDPQGVIVARCLRGSALEAKLAEVIK